MVNASGMTPSEYFGLDSKSKYSGLFNEMYKLTKVLLTEAEMEDGEIGGEEEEQSIVREKNSEQKKPRESKENVSVDDVPDTVEDLSCKSRRVARSCDVRSEPLRERQFQPPPFPPLHFPSLSLLPGSLQFPLAGGFPVPVSLGFPPVGLLPPPVSPWPRHSPAMFLPSLPPPPLQASSQEVYVPPDEKVLTRPRDLPTKLSFSGVQGVPRV